ncbi:MAG TPA: glycosyltransferase [Actinomycetota bacterium]|nr:glycosyltransferase [Actinomycetota bacterium]
MRTQPARARATSGPVDASAPSVLAIVVTHNGRTWFKDCLVGLNTQTYPFLDVLVVDDASRDSRSQPPLRRVAKRHLRRRRWGYLRTPRPLGFGGAINWAMSRVRTDADVLLFIHDDAAIDPPSVEKMVARMYQDEATAIVGPKIVSWEDPDRLEEVGMAVDRFGYPYKGLEDHEIDLGQHDSAAEVFFVTSTCMLIRHEVFKQLRGWDARMRAFTEDLDLCWRARLAGHVVRVEPAARARHAIALAKGKRQSPFTPIRYFIRRNRLRTIAKNASSLRLLALIPTFVLLTIAEMLGFIVLRQPREIGNLARGLGWNLLTLPQTLTERARAQRGRKVPDRKLRRLTVRQSTRLRFYVSHQAERLEEAWGRRAELISQRGRAAQLLGSRLRGRTGLIAAVLLIGFILGFRHILFGPPASVGELLPYPERATALWRAFLSPWRGVGLGDPGPAPPAFAFLGLFPMISFGASGLAQKLLVLGLGGAAFGGVYRLVGELVDKPSRFVAATVYALGAVGYAGVRQGALGAMVFGAAAPFVLVSMIRLIGWVRPPAWNRGRAVARVALGSAISAAFVPGSLFLYLIAGVLLTATRTFLESGSRAVRGLASSAIGLAFGWALLLPWSATWFAPGAPLDLLRGDDTWGRYAGGFAGHGFLSVIVGQTPDAPPLFGLALPVLGLVAVLVGEGQRRRMALALWTLVVAIAWLVGAFSTGALRPIVASPTEAGVLAAVAFAGLAGLAAGAFRLDLPRRGLGIHHALTLGGVAVAAFLVVAGLAPAFLRGAWDPGRASGHADSRVTEQIANLLGSTAQAEGQLRALWVGSRWGTPVPSVARPVGRHTVTGPRGEVLTDLFETRTGPSESELQAVISAVEEGRTDRGGSLLGAFNIGNVILQRGPGAYRWLSQADLAVARDNPAEEYLLLENDDVLARAGIYEELPSVVSAIDRRDPALIRGTQPPPRENAEQQGSARYRAELESGRGVVFLAEAHDPRWRARLDGETLERVEAGWANGFELPPGGGDLVLSFPRSTANTASFVVLGLAWIVILGAAFSRAAPHPRRTRR